MFYFYFIFFPFNFQKCMILVISLVELKTDNTVIKKIMRSLPLEILKKNIQRIYKRHKKLYGSKYVKESLKHVILKILFMG